MEAKYNVIKQDIINKIREGIFKPGAKIYSENDIKNKYGVSSITAVKALQELVSEGYIFRLQGKGSFVSKRKRDEMVKFSDLEFSPDTESIEVKSINQAEKNDLSSDIEDGKFFVIERVKKNGGVPYNYIKSYISTDLINLNNLKKEKLESVYDRVFMDSGVDLLKQNYKQVIKIVYPLDKNIAKMLDLKEGPAVKQKMYNYASDGRLLEHTISYKRWDYYSISLESPNME